MNESSICRRYARAIFELAADEGRFEQAGEELAVVAAGLEADPGVLVALRNPSVTREEKQQVARSLASALNLSPTVANALQLLAERGRLADLPAIASIYRTFADERAGRLRARVVSAVPLADESARQIESLLSRATQRNVVVERAVDPAILGGVVAQVGSQVYDGSVRTQLEELRKQLKA